jgi:beta-glucanase (GH16 family)
MWSNHVAKPQLELLWSQEFDLAGETVPCEAFWNFDIGDGTANGIPGWGNNELEYYVESAAKNDGQSNLVIHAERNTDKDLPAYYGRNAEWTSARLHTAGKVEFLYGHLEIRAQFAGGLGTWPALWMLGADIGTVGWPQCGEIDIAEGRGDQPGALYTTVHGPNYSGENGKGKVTEIGLALSKDFYVFAIDWLPDSITWALDGEAILTLTPDDVAGDWVFNKAHFMLANLAIGGNSTGPVSPNLLSADFRIDYIRYFSIDGVGTVNFPSEQGL